MSRLLSDVAGFPLMPDSQDCGLVVLKAIESDVAAVAEGDQDLSKLRVHFVGRAADPRMLRHDAEATPDSAGRARGGAGTLDREKR